MGATALIAQLRAQRTGRVEIRPGAVLLVRRPLEATDMHRFRGGMSAELVIEHVVGWEGITEADLLGAGIGASTPAVWDEALKHEVLADRMAWVDLCSAWLRDAIVAHLQQRAAAAKN